jgi:anti-sigma-K factor RskA
MSDHDEWIGQSAAFALGVLDADERAEFERHLAGCAECRAEVREHRETAAMLAAGAPSVQPPPGLRARVLDQARPVRPIAAARPPVATAPPRTAPSRWVAAAAVVLAIAGVSAWLLERGRRIEAEAAVATLEDSLSTRTGEIAALDSALAGRDSLLATVLAEDVRTVTLTSSGTAPAARLYWNPAGGRIVLTAHDLPPASAGRTYQLWGIADGQPLSLGVFDTDVSGRATVEFTVDPSLRFQVGAITDEPTGGSPQPTTTPFLVGQLSADQD